MIYWAYICMTVALAAGLVGFGGGGGAVAGLAQFLFFVFLVVAGALIAMKFSRDDRRERLPSHPNSRSK